MTEKITNLRPSIAVLRQLLILLWTTAILAAQGQVLSKHHITDPERAPKAGATLDGKLRVYGEWNSDGSYQLKLRDNISGAVKGLPLGQGYIYNEIISPEGKQIAYLSESDDGHIDVKVYTVQTENIKSIFSSTDVLFAQLHEWSQNEKLLAASMFMKDRSFQYLLFDIDNNTVHVLTKDFFKSMNYNFQQTKICFSPDNRFVAYDRGNGGWYPRDIFYQNIANVGIELKLIQNWGNDLLLGWAPDNRTVLFASDHSGKWNLMTAELEDGKLRGNPGVLIEDVGNIFGSFGFVSLGFKKDGSYFYTIGRPEVSLYLGNVDGDNREIEKLSTVIRFNTGVEWSHTGDSLAYVRGRGTEYDPFEIIIRNMRSGRERIIKIKELMRHGGHSFEPRWSIDGKNMITVARQRDFDGPEIDSQGLYNLELETGHIKPILRTGSICGLDCIMAPVWCSDSTLIFKRRATETIVMINLSNLIEKEIYKGPSIGSIRTDPTSNFAVSPNGEFFAFILTDWEERTNSLMVLRLKDENAHPEELLRVSGNELVSVPSWMPDSKTLVYAHTSFSSSTTFALYRISVDAKTPEPIGITNADGLIPLAIAIHPSGKKIAYTAGKPYNDSRQWWILRR